MNLDKAYLKLSEVERGFIAGVAEERKREYLSCVHTMYKQNLYNFLSLLPELTLILPATEPNIIPLDRGIRIIWLHKSRVLNVWISDDSKVSVSSDVMGMEMEYAEFPSIEGATDFILERFRLLFWEIDNASYKRSI